MQGEARAYALRDLVKAPAARECHWADARPGEWRVDDAVTCWREEGLGGSVPLPE